MAMRQRNDQPRGAVCLNAIGRLWRDASSGNPTIRTLPQYQRAPGTLEASREHWITRLISARLEEQGLNAGPEPAPCARRSDRPTHRRAYLRASVSSD
jgi:hypothetical protein